MKVLLIKPPVAEYKRIYTVHPISLGYLATSLKKANIDVSVMDCENDCYDISTTIRLMEEISPDIIGITCFSHNFHMVKNLAQAIKEVNKNITIAMGGPHANALQEKVLSKCEYLDFAFQGESEKSFVEFAIHKDDADSFKNIRGLIYRNGNKILSNQNIFENDIDQYDFIDYKLMRIEKYFKGIPQGFFYKKQPLVSIITSRGCPFPCTFCAAHINNGKKVRYRSIDNVIEEIDYLYKKYNVKEIHILDDNFTVNKDYAINLCNTINSRGYNLYFAMPNGVRLDKVDSDILNAMKGAGFYQLSVGIESGSDETLNKIKKLETTEFIKQQIALIKSFGFRITGTFIIGFPWETKEDIMQTYHFAKKLKLDFASFGNFTPLPNTEITNKMIQDGELDKDYEVPFTWGDASFIPKYITQQDIKKLQRDITFRFYLTPKRIFNFLTNIKIKNILFIFRRFLLLFRQ